ncbi:MAG: hypothetical protein M3N28_00955 [Actinomycetota bacterium]|nr:hypothetical protein [Actinomycetota bacterium]
MTDERHHASDSTEVSAGSKVDERAQLENKPILQWTREDWQLWAAGLSESRRLPATRQALRSEPVGNRPLPSEPGAHQPPEPIQGSPEPANPSPPVQTERAPEPVLAGEAASADTVELSAKVEDPAGQSTTVTLSATAAHDAPSEVQERQPSQRPERESASPSSSGPSVTQPWALRPATPLRPARPIARSAMNLMLLAVAVGALVAGLVTFVILVSGLLLRRALGS